MPLSEPARFGLLLSAFFRPSALGLRISLPSPTYRRTAAPPHRLPPPGEQPRVTCHSVASWYYAGMTKVVSIKMNPALLLRIDGLTSNRSDFIRAAVEEKVKRAGAKGKSAWDALAKTEGLDITIPEAAGQVKRIDL
jgi:hypothetical protein